MSALGACAFVREMDGRLRNQRMTGRFSLFFPSSQHVAGLRTGAQRGPAPEGAPGVTPARGAGLCPVRQTDDNENARVGAR